MSNAIEFIRIEKHGACWRSEMSSRAKSRTHHTDWDAMSYAANVLREDAASNVAMPHEWEQQTVHGSCGKCPPAREFLRQHWLRGGRSATQADRTTVTDETIALAFSEYLQ